jgi:hypothetical protein
MPQKQNALAGRGQRARDIVPAAEPDNSQRKRWSAKQQPEIASPKEAVINVQDQNIDNRLNAIGRRLSVQQRRILTYLAGAGQPIGSFIGNLPRTGDVVDQLGLVRNKTGFASVSRSLARLNSIGLIASYSPNICTRGCGYHWAVRS